MLRPSTRAIVYLDELDFDPVQFSKEEASTKDHVFTLQHRGWNAVRASGDKLRSSLEL